MNTLNLLPLQQHPAQFVLKKIRRNIQIGSLLIGLVMAGYYFIVQGTLAESSEKLAALQAKQAHDAPLLPQLATLTAQIAAQADHEAYMELQQQKNIQLLRMLSHVPQVMTQDLYLVHLTWDAQTGMMSGYAKDDAAVMTFLNALKQTVRMDTLQNATTDTLQQAHYFTIHF